jgi:hypothetical protein
MIFLRGGAVRNGTTARGWGRGGMGTRGSGDAARDARGGRAVSVYRNLD